MHGEVVVIVLVLVVGCAAFLFGVLYLVSQLFVGIGRGLMSLIRPRSSNQAAGPVRGMAGRMCPNPRCRKTEYRKARYCSQCGARLTDRNGSTES